MNGSSSEPAPLDIGDMVQNLREKNTELHQKIIAKKEVINKQRKKQRAMARANWYSMMLYARKRVLLRESASYQNKKNEKLDVFTTAAVQKLASVLRFKAATKVFEETTQKFFEPIRIYSSPPSVPIVEEAVDDASIRFMSRLSFAPSLNLIAPQMVNSIKNVDTYENLRPSPADIEYRTNLIIDDVVSHIEADPIVPSLSDITQPLERFSQDTMILNPINDINIIVSQASLMAVLQTPIAAAVPVVAKEVRKPFRSAMRMAYPRWDLEDPLDIQRDQTWDETKFDEAIQDEINKDILLESQKASKMQRSSPTKVPTSPRHNVESNLISRDLDFQPENEITTQDLPTVGKSGLKPKQFHFDLSSILPGLDDGLYKMIQPIPELVIHTRFFSRSMFEEEMNKPVNYYADLVANDPSQTVPAQSLDFIDEEIDKSLYDLLASGTGMNEVADKLIDFGMQAAEKALATNLAGITYGNVHIALPYLLGAAQIKMHNIDDDKPLLIPPEKKATANPVYITPE
ncbi:hypothetical protein TVAG_193290 [Trichomonas vaginalis G3]|uniref:Uncharacterized protein n=1 Tax=Trichomonas vaginalis (strain ATCC PRA-98 / G3) TaxID=412133 RepID=A2DH43_TRIV3|nr:hypothetical protein TVAGG3_0341280 [Trichomonas vaginalis G3]EAY20353.1 hypothetical protein TVAG_193290 [Trichomonas vaginalis G3]KAI5530656.1 hypothetical protein TVAGG3_0341280 [Trichomonas vaginalis G3]|eukprot:XP_001581339.1 hypothetical protein [Trichomonas vaginalis G3]